MNVVRIFTYLVRGRLAAFVALMLISALTSGCVDPEVQLHIDHLTEGLGLKSNIFESEPNQQLGTVVLYRSERTVQEIAKKVGFEGETHSVLQITGKLAESLLAHMAYFSKGTLMSDEQGVVYIFGELSDEMDDELNASFTIDELRYLEGKEMIVLSGTEALSFLDVIEERWDYYFSLTPDDTRRVFVVSYGEALQWTQEILFEFYEDLQIFMVTNLFSLDTIDNVRKLVADVGNVPLQGIRRVSLLTGRLWALSFDSVSKFGAFITGSELIPESVVIRRTIKLIADTGYEVTYALAETLDEASDDYGIFTNPLVAIDITSEILARSTDVADMVRDGVTEIVVGYISDNVELLGQFLNLFHENIVGDALIFVGKTVTTSIRISSLTLRAVLRFGGDGASAIIGTLSIDKPLEYKISRFKVMFSHIEEDLKSVWHEFLKLLGLR